MDIPYHSGIKATVYRIVTHILSYQGQSQTNAVKFQDYGNSFLGLAWCCAGGLYATRNNDKLRCILRKSTEALKSIAKQTVRYAVKRCFAPPRKRKATYFSNTRELIKCFGWEVLDHAPYSPSLAPSNFHLSRYFKHSLGGKRFSDSEEVKAAVNSCLSNQVADFFEEGFQNLILRYDKRINKLVNYVEK
ncbi:histone-lysine N-methyltransferase SETMAR [Trichonephila clavipes]|nr:histone-lysine N-methyltransferase SETMAR [Trichonephila clavipes]